MSTFVQSTPVTGGGVSTDLKYFMETDWSTSTFTPTKPSQYLAPSGEYTITDNDCFITISSWANSSDNDGYSGGTSVVLTYNSKNITLYYLGTSFKANVSTTGQLIDIRGLSGGIIKVTGSIQNSGTRAITGNSTVTIYSTPTT